MATSPRTIAKKDIRENIERISHRTDISENTKPYALIGNIGKRIAIMLD
jgi:hypothetical protein